MWAIPSCEQKQHSQCTSALFRFLNIKKLNSVFTTTDMVLDFRLEGGNVLGTGLFMWRVLLLSYVGHTVLLMISIQCWFSSLRNESFSKYKSLPGNVLWISSSLKPLVTMFCPHYTQLSVFTWKTAKHLPLCSHWGQTKQLSLEWWWKEIVYQSAKSS